MLPPFKAGQHLPVELKVPGQPDRISRSYSLSGSPGTGAYRISVKREDHGIASTFLHSGLGIGGMIEARPPAGDFILPGGQGAILLVSAGVGVTPMISMLHAVAARQSGRRIGSFTGPATGGATPAEPRLMCLSERKQASCAKPSTAPPERPIYQV